jgi:hypothetical protein
MRDYAVEALSRLTGQFANSLRLRAMLAAIVSPLASLELDADALRAGRWIDSAVGVQLDGCGHIVGESRLGRDDDAYRAAIRFRVFVNVSNGTPVDMIRGLLYLTNPVDCQYLEVSPATALLFTDGLAVTAETAAIMQDLAPAAISDVPLMVSHGSRPFRFSRASLPGELFVNDEYLTAGGADLQVSEGGTVSGGYSLGGIVAAELDAGGFDLDVGIGTLAVYDPNNLHTLGHDNLTGVHQ